MYVLLGKDDSDNRLEKVGAFVKWLDKNHVDHNSVKLAKISEGVGLGLHAAHAMQVYFYCIYNYLSGLKIDSKGKNFSLYQRTS